MKILSSLLFLYVAMIWSTQINESWAQQYPAASQQRADYKLSECAQVDSAARWDFDKAEDRAIYWHAKGKCISNTERPIADTVLSKDKVILQKTYPQIRDFYVKYSKQDVAKVMTLAWIKYRAASTSKPFTAEAFIQASTSYGQLTITSNPDGASIAVDSNPWDGPTNVTDWTEAGERSVELIREKCQRERGKVTVVAGGRATFHRDLTCQATPKIKK